MNIFSRANQWIPWEFFFRSGIVLWINTSAILKRVLFFWINVPCLNFMHVVVLHHLSQTVKTKTNKQNEGVQLKLFHESKFHVILRVNGHLDYYWSESKIAERATITKVTGIMQFYDECQPDYITFV